jgi:hypothetical protein
MRCVLMASFYNHDSGRQSPTVTEITGSRVVSVCMSAGSKESYLLPSLRIGDPPDSAGCALFYLARTSRKSTRRANKTMFSRTVAPCYPGGCYAFTRPKRAL